MSLLEVNELCVRYGRLTAVHELAFEVYDGEIAVLLGTNGAGKSSTINAISGAIRVSAGSVRFKGKDITKWPSHAVARSGLVQVPEGRRIIGPLTVEENLLVGAYNVLSRERRADLLSDVYGMFPILSERSEQPGGLLSGGQQQMLAFGRALMADPSLILLDEPSMGLAPVMVDRVMESVRRIAERGISVLMVEQNASAAFDVATKAYLMDQGELVLSGTVDEVRQSPKVLSAFLGIESEHTPVSQPNPVLTTVKQREGTV